VRRLPEGLRVDAAFRPELFVNHYGSSEIYTFTVEQHAARKPGSAGKAGINQRIRVVSLAAETTEAVARTGEEGQIIADLTGDEAFEGYWRRPDADARALRQGWYLTGDTGYVDEAGDLFVMAVDDKIITGGENVSRRRDREHPVAAPGDRRNCRRRVAGRASGAARHRFCQARGGGRGGGARRLMPQFAARRLQAAARLEFCRRNPEIAGRQDPAPQARRR
jgi:acyl-CoA synthetase (AMP-forming)/AMP-acid ligase II